MSFTPEHFTVWTEIPVADLDRAIAFYNTVLDTDLKKDESGPNPMAMFPTSTPGGVSGHLYPGKPAKEGGGPDDPPRLPRQAGGCVGPRDRSAGGNSSVRPRRDPRRALRLLPRQRRQLHRRLLALIGPLKARTHATRRPPLSDRAVSEGRSAAHRGQAGRNDLEVSERTIYRDIADLAGQRRADRRRGRVSAT